jgi:hypothetical protein
MTVGAAALEQPGEVGLDIHAMLLRRADHAEQGRPPMAAFGAAGEQTRSSQLCVVAFILPISGRS